MQSSFIRDALVELDTQNASVLIQIGEKPQVLRFRSESQLGSCEVEFGEDSTAFETFECIEDQAQYYKCDLLRPAIRALQMSTKTSLRMNTQGTLSIQCMIKKDEQVCGWVYGCHLFTSTLIVGEGTHTVPHTHAHRSTLTHAHILTHTHNTHTHTHIHTTYTHTTYTRSLTHSHTYIRTYTHPHDTKCTHHSVTQPAHTAPLMPSHPLNHPNATRRHRPAGGL